MDTLNALFSRRSIRSYTGQPVSENDLRTVVKAAWASPVGMGRFDSLHLTVITNPDLLAEIDENAGGGKSHPLYGAPALIVVSSQLFPGAEKVENNVPSANAAMAVHNMALACVALGLGHVDIYGAIRALIANEELTGKLGLPEGYTPLAALAFGPTNEKYDIREIPNDKIRTDWIK